MSYRAFSIQGKKQQASITFDIRWNSNYQCQENDLYSSNVINLTKNLDLQLQQKIIASSNYELFLLIKTNSGCSFNYEGAIIALDFHLSQNNCYMDSSENLMMRFFVPNSYWSFGTFSLQTLKSSPNCSVNCMIQFHLVQSFDFTSSLSFSFSPPSKTPFFKLLNNKFHSDCCFKLKKGSIWANKAILSAECQFFEKMFEEAWAKQSKKNGGVEIFELTTWSDEVVIACILHLYTGWIPRNEICNEVFVKLNVTPATLELDLEALCEMAEFASMLQLDVLAYACLREIGNLVKTKIKLLTENFSKKF